MCYFNGYYLLHQLLINQLVIHSSRVFLFIGNGFIAMIIGAMDAVTINGIG
jgi:hypothetical protein